MSFEGLFFLSSRMTVSWDQHDESICVSRTYGQSLWIDAVLDE